MCKEKCDTECKEMCHKKFVHEKSGSMAESFVLWIFLFLRNLT